MSYPFNIRATSADPDIPYVLGTGDVALNEGDVLTSSAAKRAVVLGNARIRVKYDARTPDVQRGCHMLQVKINGTWTDAMEADMGDWSYFTISITSVCDRVTVIEKSPERVRVAFQWDVFDLSSYSGGGIVYRDEVAEAVNYAQSSSTAKRITSTVLVKTICVQYGEPGYYVGWHSEPRVGKPNSLVSAASSTDYGERELGLGGGTAVAWSSGRTAVARWPAWANDADGRWTSAGLASQDNKIYWCGIKDPTYSPFNSAGWLAVQGSGYPNTQTTGPFYVGSIHYSIAVCQFMVSRIARTIGFWQVGTRGGAVSVFTDEDHQPSGIPYEHQLFIGAVPYTADSSSSYANEPTQTIQDTVEDWANAISWPAF